MTDNDFLIAECRREYGALLDKHTKRYGKRENWPAAGDLGISISTAHHWLRMAGIRPTVRRKTVLKRAK